MGNNTETESVHTGTDDVDGSRRLIRGGIRLAEGLAAALPGVALAASGVGVEGEIAAALADSMMPHAVNQIGHEVSSRLLSPREEERVGFVFAQATKEIKDRIDAGEEVRADGFFGPGLPERSDGAAVWESVLLKSQREAEEKKLPYMARLLSNAAFEPRISAELVHRLAKGADGLTYRQFCILNLVENKERYPLRASDFSSETLYPIEAGVVIDEFYSLCSLNWVGHEKLAMLNAGMICPSEMSITGLALVAYPIMGLERIPEDDLAPLVEYLGEERTGWPQPEA